MAAGNMGKLKLENDGNVEYKLLYMQWYCWVE